jgi:hypothetical protein
MPVAAAASVSSAPTQGERGHWQATRLVDSLDSELSAFLLNAIQFFTVKRWHGPTPDVSC